jgi:outer membrane murein-binding lipoprotein Lpp
MNSISKKSAGYVQANSVQSQFAALTRDRDTFQAEQEAAERESMRAQERLQRLKQEQVALMTKIQMAQESLGDLSRKQTMLKQEKARLHRVTESERKALEDCAGHTTKLAQQEQEMTKKYITELEKLNGDVASDLENQIIGKVLKYVSVESVENVVAANFPAATANKQVFDDKFGRMKRIQEMLQEELDRCQKAKAEFNKIEKMLAHQQDQSTAAAGEVYRASPHLDIFYGHEGANATGN